MSAWQWQADTLVSRRAMQLIGALRTYAARMQFFLGVPMIAVLFYNDSPLLQSYIPTVYHWVAIILFGVVPTAVAIDRVLLHPAQIIYNSYQTDESGRSPNYQVTVETKEEVERLHERLDEVLEQ